MQQQKSPPDENEESPNTTDENVPEADDNQPDNTLPEPQDGAEPCPVGQVTNPQTGECETSSPPPTNVNNNTVPNNAVSNNTIPNNTAPIINGNCNAVAISEGVNASSAAAASVTCINQQINNVIKQQRVGQVVELPQEISMVIEAQLLVDF